MPDKPDYFDIRQEAFRGWFEKGLPYDDYLAASDSKHAERWRDAEKSVVLSSAQKALLGSFSRRMPVICISGVWCGDCVRQGPIFKAFENATPKLEFRYLEREEHPDLMDELRICGAKKVPVVLFLTEDFFEVERFGDRTLSVYRRKVEKELGPACPIGITPPDKGEITVEVQEWLGIVERVHIMLRLSPPLRRRYED
jgi:hypothetical protein